MVSILLLWPCLSNKVYSCTPFESIDYYHIKDILSSIFLYTVEAIWLYTITHGNKLFRILLQTIRVRWLLWHIHTYTIYAACTHWMSGDYNFLWRHNIQKKLLFLNTIEVRWLCTITHTCILLRIFCTPLESGDYYPT